MQAFPGQASTVARYSAVGQIQQLGSTVDVNDVALDQRLWARIPAESTAQRKYWHCFLGRSGDIDIWHPRRRCGSREFSSPSCIRTPVGGSEGPTDAGLEAAAFAIHQ